MEFNLNSLHYDTVHLAVLSSKYGGVVKLDVVFKLDAVFGHGWLVGMFQTYVSLMFFQPYVHKTARLPNVDLAAFTGDSVNSRCPQSQVILKWPEEIRYFLGW
jgi:hypothetical protein